MPRPPLIAGISEKEFKSYYWLKSELLQFCHDVTLSTHGGKQEVAERIALFLRTGVKQKPAAQELHPLTNYKELSLNTIVTNAFTCTR